MSSSGSGYRLKRGASPDTYEAVGAVLAINSMQPGGKEFWWALVPANANLNPEGITAINIALEARGSDADSFAWADPPARVDERLSDYVTRIALVDGKCQIVLTNAPIGAFDVVLRVTVDGTVVELDPEVDVGMPGAH